MGKDHKLGKKYLKTGNKMGKSHILKGKKTCLETRNKIRKKSHTEKYEEKEIKYEIK